LVAQAFRVSSEGFWSRGCLPLRDCFYRVFWQAIC
jgi:hypothetical protein